MKLLHRCLPQTLTPENLAKWITDNGKNEFTHIEKTDLDEEAIHELERKSSMASRAIDDLEDLKKQFMTYLKEGTPPIGGDGPNSHEHGPLDITIPPTKGLKELKANRQFADKQLKAGHSEDEIQIWFIPYPEDDLMVAVDIEGNEWPEYTRRMSIEEINGNKPLLRETKPKGKKKAEESFMDESADASSLDL